MSYARAFLTLAPLLCALAGEARADGVPAPATSPRADAPAAGSGPEVSYLWHDEDAAVYDLGLRDGIANAAASQGSIAGLLFGAALIKLGPAHLQDPKLRPEDAVENPANYISRQIAAALAAKKVGTFSRTPVMKTGGRFYWIAAPGVPGPQADEVDDVVQADTPRIQLVYRGLDWGHDDLRLSTSVRIVSRSGRTELSARCESVPTRGYSYNRDQILADRGTLFHQLVWTAVHACVDELRTRLQLPDVPTTPQGRPAGAPAADRSQTTTAAGPLLWPAPEALPASAPSEDPLDEGRVIVLKVGANGSVRELREDPPAT